MKSKPQPKPPKPNPIPKNLGQTAEKLVEKKLTSKGFVPVTRNYYSRHGEIDLIMRHRDVLVFIEVKQRSSSQYGGAISAVSSSKLRKLELTIQHYLVKHPYNGPIRLDVVGVDSQGNLEHLINVTQ